MELELENIHFDTQKGNGRKFINFTIHSKPYYAVIALSETTGKWEISSVHHDGNIDKEKKCSLCDEEQRKTKSTICFWFMDKSEELQHHLLNHLTFRIKALLELG